MSYIDGFVIPVPTADAPFNGQRMIFGGFEVLLDTDGELGK